ncbi:YncE family protein [Mucilaginibacter sp. L3T2-6]|uniref:YncE family protein n=1 Tax=Mucilaginibacter sp. L3T2-6 TaxID=3062491 RepID=UPI00267733B8|nr:hypothetical protein [Mucilaginibacter sp. L3T2-6]MDO3640873.1 hypothetical protein [Mucilaginibacter sp. L3T2-6]MDV6213651.1 hypothetical protein [Mucilaginibacter sp. L3T2-6]
MKNILLPVMLAIGNMAMAQTKLVAVQQYRDSVVVFNLDNNIKIAQAGIPFKSHEITYDPATKKCFISNFGLEDYDLKIGKTGNTVTTFDPFKGKVTGYIYTGGDTSAHNGPHGIKIRPQHGELFVNTEIGGDTMRVFSTGNYKLKRLFTLPKGTHNFWFTAKGDTLWLMSGQNGVYRIDPGSGAVLQHAGLPTPVRGLLVAKKWLVASCKNEIFLLSKTDLSVIRHFSNLQLKAGLILYSNITEDQKYILAPAPFDSVVLVIDSSTGNVVHRIETGDTPINVQVNGSKAYVSHAKDYMATIDLNNFTSSKNLKAYGTNGLLVIK